MKKLFSFLLAAAISAAAGFSASAQMSFQAGVTMPYQRELQMEPLAIYDRYGIGAYFGFDYDIHIIKGFSISPGLFYNFTSAKSSGYEDRFYAEETQRDHNLFKTEQDANIRALEYFNDKLENFNPQTDWNHRENPIIGYNPNKNITNPENQAALKTGKLSLNWYDPLLVTSLGVTPGNIISGFINAKAYVK